MFSIRCAREGDLSALLAVETECFNSDLINRRQMRYLLFRAKAITLVAVHQTDQIIGYCIGLIPSLPRAARVYSLAVLPQWRGWHVASALLEDLITRLGKQGYRHCVLEVRETDIGAWRLYQRMGFEQFAQAPGYYEDGATALRMRRRLDKPFAPGWSRRSWPRGIDSEKTGNAREPGDIDIAPSS